MSVDYARGFADGMNIALKRILISIFGENLAEEMMKIAEISPRDNISVSIFEDYPKWLNELLEELNE